MTGYRKEGRALLLTRSRSVRARTTVLERGVAGESQGRFFSMSLDPEDSAAEPGDFTPLERLEARISAAAGSARIDRLRIHSGWTRQGYGEERTWEESHVRVQIEWVVTRAALRLTTMRGGANLGEIDGEELGNLARALVAARPWRDPVSGPIAIGAPVAAAIAAAGAAEPAEISAVRLVQTPHPAWPRDGNGRSIVRTIVADDPPPNLWRPSYRSPAAPAFLHVEIEPAGAAPMPSVIAIETLGPVRIAGNRARFPALLIVDERAGAADLELDLEGMASAGGEEAPRWFPFGAGAWGRVLVSRNGWIR